MENSIDKRSILLNVKNKIQRMPNNIKRVKTIEGYANLFGYYKEICGLSDYECVDLDLEDDSVDKYDRYVIKKTKKKLVEITRLASYLYQRYDKLINLYKENEFCSFEFSISDKANIDEMYDNIAEFINLLGKDVGMLYNNMIKGDNIFLLEDPDYLGASMNSISIDSPCMIIQNMEKFIDFYITLAHELGHCYQFYLQRNHTHFETFNPLNETASTFFEKLFVEFLRSKGKYQKAVFDYELEDNIYLLNTLSSSKVLCNLLINKDLINVNAYNLTYQTNTPIEIMLRDMTNDCGYIMENKFDFQLTEFHYSIGNVIASYFINKSKKDFYGTLKEFKDFICTMDDYPLEDILDKYFDMNLMEEKIKTFTKSYHNR